MIRGILIADLDGTFIDHDTYEPGPSVLEAQKLHHEGVHMVFCSSKTAAEQLAIRDMLRIPVTMIVENGSAIYRWGSSAPEILGCTVEHIRHVAEELRLEGGLDLRLMGEIEVDEAMRETGLDRAAATLAQQREFSESVVSPRDDQGRLAELAEAFGRHGLAATMGGRFLTIHGPNASKGRAVARLLADHSVISGAVGDGPNDISMLAEVDFPYLIRSIGMTPPDPGLPGLKFIDAFGPAGFVLAAEDFLRRTKEALSELLY